MEGGRVFVDPPGLDKWQPRAGMFVNTGLGAPPASIKVPPATSRLVAWNPATQKQAWSIPQPGVFNGGVLSTGGNVLFQGQNTGIFAAYAADSGRELWTFDAQDGILSAPISYSVGGRQYVTVIASFRSSFAGSPNWDYRQQKRRVLTFALGGARKLPPFVRVDEPVLDDPAFVVEPAKAAIGASIYNTSCVICHGAGMMAGGAAPDLRTSAIPLDGDAFASVVRDGGLMSRGMPGFGQFTPAELDGLRHYIRQRARETMPKK
jgi:quinohemoprotein ethanol dehydrogenase